MRRIESQLTVGGGAVYFFLLTYGGAAAELMSLDAKTGAQRWAQALTKKKDSESIISATPQYQGAVAPAGGAVVAVIPSLGSKDAQQMVAFAAADGKKLWTLPLPML